MTPPPAARTALSGAAFATLLLIALLMGANHVAARVAFDHGVDVVTAVAFRSALTALVVGALLVVQRTPVRVGRRPQRALLAIGVLVAVQSFCLYSAVARLPVALGCPVGYLPNPDIVSQAEGLAAVSGASLQITHDVAAALDWSEKRATL